MQEKIKNSVKIIESFLCNSRKPAIAWSGGKDSMALLDLLYNKVGIRVPVIFFREQWQPKKYAFQNRIIEEWGLEVYTWHPAQTSFQQSGDELEVQNIYFFDNTMLTCPTGITPPQPGKPWVCSMDILNRPKNKGISAGWDGLLVGHKLCDSDPIYGGDAGTRIEARVNPGQASIFFPIRDWTHADVFRYCEENKVPIQTSRYEKKNGEWSEKKDKTHNCDYVHACTACVDRRPDSPRFVHCPKFGCVIENISGKLPWGDQAIPTYMKD